MLLASVACPLTTHPFRDGASFPLPMSTPLPLVRSLRFFHEPYRSAQGVTSSGPILQVTLSEGSWARLIIDKYVLTRLGFVAVQGRDA